MLFFLFYRSYVCLFMFTELLILAHFFYSEYLFKPFVPKRQGKQTIFSPMSQTEEIPQRK